MTARSGTTAPGPPQQGFSFPGNMLSLAGHDAWSRVCRRARCAARGRKMMTIRIKIILSAFLAGVGLAGPALAAPGVVVGGTDIFAGPSPAYPIVGALPPGAPIEIFGCQPGWGWCDVAGGPYRGWAPSDRVQILYDGSPGPLSEYGPMIGLPLIGFAFGHYWGTHYRDRPWFSSYDRWGGGRGEVVRGRGPGGGPDRHWGAGPGGPGPGWSGRGGPPPGDHRGGGFPGGGPGNARGGDNRGGDRRGGSMPHADMPHGGPPGGNRGHDGHGGHDRGPR